MQKKKFSLRLTAHSIQTLRGLNWPKTLQTSSSDTIKTSNGFKDNVPYSSLTAKMVLEAPGGWLQYMS